IEPQDFPNVNIERLNYKENVAYSSDPEFSQAFSEIQNDQIWNGLARIRRRIELILKEKVRNSNIKSSNPQNLRNLLRQANILELIDRRDFVQINLAVSICNRGIHGEDIDKASALLALRLGSLILKLIN
ncbi:hypothetical protein, partial [Leptospira wolffii]